MPIHGVLLVITFWASENVPKTLATLLPLVSFSRTGALNKSATIEYILI